MVLICNLKYIQKWSKRWLVKINPSKTDNMVFSANNQQNDLTFDFNSTRIQTVNTHPWGAPALSSPTLEIASLIITL
jgi:hypothetical protein